MTFFFLKVYVSTKLALFSLAVVPPVAAMSIIYGRYMRGITRRVQDSLASATEVTILLIIFFFFEFDALHFIQLLK